MDQLLGCHLVDERDRVPKRVLDLRWILGINRRTNIAQRAAKAGAQSAVVLSLLNVLTVRFERGIVTGHSLVLVLWNSSGNKGSRRQSPETRTTFELYHHRTGIMSSFLIKSVVVRRSARCGISSSTKLQTPQ